MYISHARPPPLNPGHTCVTLHTPVWESAPTMYYGGAFDAAVKQLGLLPLLPLLLGPRSV